MSPALDSPKAQTPSLPAIACPVCCGVIDGVVPAAKPMSAAKFDDCLRRCEKCGVGVSNTRGENPTFIYRDPLANIPAEARSGALLVLGQALNVHSRISKLRRFGFSTSEDAITWVVFSYLLTSGRLVAALGNAGILPSATTDVSPTLLLWGCPLGNQPRGRMIAEQLATLCNDLGEDNKRRSEPDVVVDLGEAGLIFIEVKHQSGNDRLPPDSPKWSRYSSPGRLQWRYDEVKQSGCYELARNWCLMKGLAGRRPGTLVNLGPSRLFAGSEGVRLDRFARSLNADEQCRFQRLTWTDFLRSVIDVTPEWFTRFCSEDRHLFER